MTRKTLLAFVLLVFIATAFIGAAFQGTANATTTNVYPSDDATIESAYPNSNFGSSEVLQTGYNLTSNSIEKSYLKFSLSAFNLTAITQATLYLSCCGLTANFDVDIYKPISDTWLENSITYNNAPPPETFIVGFNVYIADSNWYSINLTDTVKAETDNVLTLILQNASYLGDAVATFFSEEGSLRPYLQIEYTPAPSPSPSPTPPPSYSNSTEIGVSGTWDNSTFPNYSEDGSERTNVQGRANVTFGQMNASGIQLGLNINKLYGDRYEWWWTSGVKRFYFALELTDGSTHVYSLFYIAHEQGVFIQTAQTIFGVGQNSTITRIGNAESNLANTTYGVQMIKLNETTIGCYYITDYAMGVNNFELGIYPTYKIAFNENFTVPSDFWNHTITINLYVGHEGNGAFDVIFDNLFQDNNISPYQSELTGTVGGFWDFLKDTQKLLEGIWAFLVGGFTFILGMISIFTGIMLKLTPYLPYLALFYLLDVAAESVRQGSFQPIGAAFRWVFDLFLKAYDTIIHLGQLVWDAITFWT